MNKQEFYVTGMHCAACELLIEKRIGKIDGVKGVNAILSEEKVIISSETELDPDSLSKLVEDSGYKILKSKSDPNVINFTNLYMGFAISVFLFSSFILLQELGIAKVFSSDKTTLPFAFFVGIIASLSTCMAVVGGLVLTISSTYSKGNHYKPLIAFHISRIVGFFIFGGVIGMLGSTIELNKTSTFLLNLVLFFVMTIMGINLLSIFPVFRKFQFKIPKFIGKNVLGFENSNSPIAPILLGLATFILPCGFTQSMQLYSLTTGSFIEGAATMFVFALGTFPVLSLISFASVKLSKSLQSDLFFKVAGFIIIFFAIFSFTSALAAIGWIEPIFSF